MFLSSTPPTQQSQFHFPLPHMLFYLFPLYPLCTTPVFTLYPSSSPFVPLFYPSSIPLYPSCTVPVPPLYVIVLLLCLSETRTMEHSI